MAGSTLKSTLLLGTAAGMRTLAPWGGLSIGSFYHESLSGFLGKKLKLSLLTALGAELIVDKLPVTGARISPVQLIPRAISGGLSSASLANHKQGPVFGYAILGGVMAIISAFFSMRPENGSGRLQNCRML